MAGQEVFLRLRQGELDIEPAAVTEHHDEKRKLAPRVAHRQNAGAEAGRIRRAATYTRPYAARRNWLFFLTFARGLKLPALAWMIGRTINGPIAAHDLPGIFVHTAVYLALVLLMVTTSHFRQRFALELGEAVAHDLRAELFGSDMGKALSKLNRRAEAIARLRESVRLKADYWEGRDALGEKLAFDKRLVSAQSKA